MLNQYPPFLPFIPKITFVICSSYQSVQINSVKTCQFLQLVFFQIALFFSSKFMAASTPQFWGASGRCVLAASSTKHQPAATRTRTINWNRPFWTTCLSRTLDCRASTPTGSSWPTRGRFGWSRSTAGWEKSARCFIMAHCATRYAFPIDLTNGSSPWTMDRTMEKFQLNWRRYRCEWVDLDLLYFGEWIIIWSLQPVPFDSSPFQRLLKA